MNTGQGAAWVDAWTVQRLVVGGGGADTAVVSWTVCGVALPGGDRPVDFWVDASGCAAAGPLAGAQRLPGRYVLAGLVDAHAHPAVGDGPGGPVALDARQTVAVLRDWARSGVSVVRDVGSPGGLTLRLDLPAGVPRVQAAGRFLAPAGQYFPALLPEGVPQDRLTEAALGELSRGAVWVKLIADFPMLTNGTAAGGAQATYTGDAITQLVTAVHAAGGRVAAHSTTATVTDLVRAGVDSIEHGTAMDEATLQLMAESGAAWTPTLCAVLAPATPSTASGDAGSRSTAAASSSCCRSRTPSACRSSPAPTPRAASAPRSRCSPNTACHQQTPWPVRQRPPTPSSATTPDKAPTPSRSSPTTTTPAKT